MILIAIFFCINLPNISSMFLTSASLAASDIKRCNCDPTFQELFCLSVSASEVNRSINLYQKFNTLGIAMVTEFPNNTLTSNDLNTPSLKELINLAIIRSEIYFIDGQAFINLMYLQSLILSSLPLRNQLYRDTFHGLWRLENLFLTNLSISYLENGIFDELKELKYLWVDGNKLKEFQHPQVNLRQLNLSNNKIEDYYPSECQDRLIEAIFVNNSLSVFLPEFYSHIKALRTLDLRGNSIKYLDLDQLLEKAESLDSLMIQHNDWYCDDVVKMCEVLEKHNIYYLNDHEADYSKWNLNGIPCTQREISTSRKPNWEDLKTFIPTGVNFPNSTQ